MNRCFSYTSCAIMVCGNVGAGAETSLAGAYERVALQRVRESPCEAM